MNKTASAPPTPSRTPAPFPRLIGVAIATIGVVILAGWLSGLPSLTSGGAARVPTNPSVALALVLAGLSFALPRIAPEETGQSGRLSRRRLSLLTAVLVTALGAGTWIDVLSHGRLTLDRLLFGPAIGGAAAAWPGAISPGAAMSVLLAGVALLLRQAPRLQAPCCLFAAAGGALPLAAFSFGATAPVGDRGLVSLLFMGPMSAALLLGLFVARAIERRCANPFDCFSRSESGRGLVRRLLPAAVVIPVLISWVAEQGKWSGAYDGETSLALFAAMNSLVIAIVVLWNARLLDRSDAERGRAEEKLRKTETQLRQSQKMDTLGKLAAGIAHDFNNLLTSILGRAELVLQRLDRTHPLRREVEEIRRSGERAAGLTRELLAFTRQQVLNPKVLDLNSAVAEMAPMLGRLIGAHIELVGDFGPQVGPVLADPTQIEQVIMNLVLNARDAMPGGGRITIATRNVELGPDEARRRGHQPGPYVTLSVSDTGSGIPAEVLGHLFEPFFTTKEQGKGTGLGLATVQGIVKQSGGSIWVTSEPGEGTEFLIYLPRTDRPAAPDETAAAAASPVPGAESVLVVEDEEGVRGLVGEVLEMNGYRVRSARDGTEAMRIMERLNFPIDLLVTDVVMPGMGGRELADRLKSADPALRVLFMSGHTDDSVVKSGILDCGTHFLQKPFPPAVLASKVREVLGEGKAA